MPDDNARQVLSRVPDGEFVGRDSELARISALADIDSPTSAHAQIVLVLGPRRVGKTELLRKCFDGIFNQFGPTVPFFYSPARPADANVARDYFTQALAQFIAFRRNDPSLISVAGEPLAVIARAAAPQDYLRAKSLIDSFIRALESGDGSLIARCAVRAPAALAARVGLRALVMIDNAHLMAGNEIRSDLFRELTGDAPAGGPRYVLAGLQRAVVEMITEESGLIDRLQIEHLQPVGEDSLTRLILRWADALEVETNESTVELMIEQLNRDLLYSRAMIDASAARGALKTFIEFERLYVDQLRRGRLALYFESLIREVAGDSRSARATLEALKLLTDAGSPVPVEVVTERIAEYIADPEALLARLHSHELLDLSYGFASRSSDPVLSDYVCAKYRREIASAAKPIAGDELLADKLKQSHALMMSRYNRAIESQLIDVLLQFDSQSAPASLFDQEAYEKRYRGMSRVQVRRALEDEQEQIRLPQIVVVNDAGSGSQPGVSWRLLAAGGFEAGIYADANEVVWMIALINSREPVDLETLGRIDQRVEQALRAHAPTAAQAVRWYVSKEGFSAIAHERLATLRAYRSTFSQLDLIQDQLTKFALGEARPAAEFELVIPIEGDAELIAARTAEQIARAADFDTEAINQIKTALIEACINAAEHGQSPDGKIYQRFAIDRDKLIITVFNKGKTFGWAEGQSTPAVAAQPAKGARGRGLQIIRALMDEVKFERTEDGARLIMTKYLKRPATQ